MNSVRTIPIMAAQASVTVFLVVLSFIKRTQEERYYDEGVHRVDKTHRAYVDSCFHRVETDQFCGLVMVVDSGSDTDF